MNDLTGKTMSNWWTLVNDQVEISKLICEQTDDIKNITNDIAEIQDKIKEILSSNVLQSLSTTNAYLKEIDQYEKAIHQILYESFPEVINRLDSMKNTLTSIEKKENEIKTMLTEQSITLGEQSLSLSEAQTKLNAIMAAVIVPIP